MYKIISTKINDVKGKAHKTFGISCKGGRVDDISFDRYAIATLVKLFNRYKLEPVHLENAVEDFLLKNCNSIG